jgi:hypothetical protein
MEERTLAMSRSAPVHRRAAVVLALLSTVVVALGAAVSPAAAVPPSDPNADGAPNLMQAQLTTAAAAYVAAKAKLDASRGRQANLTEQLNAAQARLTALDGEVGGVAAAAYRGSRANVTLVLLSTDSPNAFLHSAATVQYLAWRDDREIHDLLAARRDYRRQRADLDNEIAIAEQQLAEMAKRKADLERALGNPASAPGVGPTGRATAKPAPRSANGAWSPEGCIIKDPTSSGCVTPRMLNAYQQARAAGFTHYTHCYTPSGTGEHPKGRACDFAANANGFANVRAAGADKAYGDRLAAWLIANADRLAVMYVIWYKQFWSPATGWKAYRGDGTVAGDHYNHVHLSVY